MSHIATIKDVARKAGISVSTVSRYLNNHPYIAEEKRLKIKQAMEELDYTPSSVATTLRSNKGTMIGVLVSRITNPYFSYLIDAIEKEAKVNGYSLLIVQTYDDQKAEQRMLEMLKQKLVNGIILCSVESKKQVIEQYSTYGPIVLCNQRLEDSKIPQIVTNQEQITYEAIRFLISKGYQKIAYCTGGKFFNKSHGYLRVNGFKRAMEENQYKINPKFIFENVHSIEDGYKIVNKLLQLPQKKWPDAIFTGSDEVASGMIELLLQHGKKIPEDIAVMGFDNQPFSRMVAVPITTVEQPIEALGKEATQYLIHLLAGKDYQVNQSLLELKLIKRKSV